ncbi:hypothetical protein [Kordia sp.]|uniref:hypothetical protein n=1 Tax=Kordia sp. TaxID=1965332 RepID=UPI003D6B330B
MKSKFLKLNKACSEQWDNMKPNEKGSFCDTCSKNVIDFTQLSQLEISEKIKNTKGEICARLTKQQLETPLIDLEIQKKYKLPYSNIAASIVLASTMAVSTTSCAQNEKAPTEFVKTTNSNSKLNSKEKISRPKATAPASFVTFKGIVKSEENGILIANAKITLVTVQKMFTAHSLEDGTFSMEIPAELIDDDNVIRVSYDPVTTEDGKRNLRLYSTEDYILSKKEVTSDYIIKAEAMVYILGGIGHYTKKNPVVIQNNERVSYKDFVNAQRGEKNSCNLENKDFLYFEEKAAVAIYGKEAEAGLFILVDKTKK